MKVHRWMWRLALLATPLLLVLAVAVPAAAEQETAQPQMSLPHATMWSAADFQGADLGTGDGMRAAVDPKTGAVQAPSRAQVALLDAQQPQRRARIFAASQVELADGTVMMAVDEELLNFSLARIDGAGHATFSCVDDASTAELEILTTAAPAREEK